MYPERSTRLVSKMLDNYYEDVEKPIIFDRAKDWGHPTKVNMLKASFKHAPKIIFTTRPVDQALASFIAINKDGALKLMKSSGFKMDESLDISDNICDFLMGPDRAMTRSLETLKSMDSAANAGIFHVVKYEDLLNSPEETMRKIYDFLGIENFNHDFNNIERIETYNESKVDLPEDLHKVRPVLGKGDIKVEDYLTPRSIEKYKDVRYF